VAAVLLFVLTQSVPAIMLLVLVVALYLVWIDIKDEPGLAFLHKAWWFLFVLLLHVPGYLIFRVWIAVRRHRRDQEAHPTTPGPRGRRGGGRA
jgi:membrane protein implicated in regulation of membrane protease activity